MTLQTTTLRQPVPARPMPLHEMPSAARPLALRPVAPPQPAPVVGDDLFTPGGEMVSIARDEVLFYEGDEADMVYRVVSGMVRTSILLPDGRRHIVDFLQAGDIVGLTAGADHPHTAEAVTAATLIRIPRSRLDSAIDQRPALARRMFRRTQADLVAAQERLLLLGRKSVTERLASFLLILRDRQSMDAAAGRRIRLPMGRTDIADYLGLTIETVSRTFTKLRSAGLIRLVDTHTVEILEPTRLADLAAGA